MAVVVAAVVVEVGVAAVACRLGWVAVLAWATRQMGVVVLVVLVLVVLVAVGLVVACRAVARGVREGMCHMVARVREETPATQA